MKTVPATSVAAFSDGFLCPHCQAPLEVTEYSRMPAVVVGLLAAWLVWRVTSGADGALGAVLPELYAILAFAIVTPLVLMFMADLRLAPPPPRRPLRLLQMTTRRRAVTTSAHSNFLTARAPLTGDFALDPRLFYRESSHVLCRSRRAIRGLRARPPTFLPRKLHVATAAPLTVACRAGDFGSTRLSYRESSTLRQQRHLPWPAEPGTSARPDFLTAKAPRCDSSATYRGLQSRGLRLRARPATYRGLQSRGLFLTARAPLAGSLALDPSPPCFSVSVHSREL